MLARTRTGDLYESDLTLESMTNADPDLSFNSAYFWFFILEVVMYFVFTMLMSQLILGVIVDTFGILRETKSDIEARQKTECFFCGVRNNQFSKVGGFHDHVMGDHNIWCAHTCVCGYARITVFTEQYTLRVWLDLTACCILDTFQELRGIFCTSFRQQRASHVHRNGVNGIQMPDEDRGR